MNYPEYSLKPAAEKSIQKSSEKVVMLIKEHPSITTREMAENLGMSHAGIVKVVKKLKDKGQIKRIGPDKGGHWEVND